MPRAARTTVGPVVFTQLITRFDRNGEREITLALLRQVRRGMTRDMRAAGATGSMIWRLGRTRSGITVTAMWDPRRERMIELARPSRVLRLERGRTGCAPANRRRLGRTTLDALRRPVALAAR